MDFIELNKCGGKKCRLGIIDTFSKWTEVFPCTHSNALSVAKALVKEIIPRHGIPERIYSDNGAHFVNQLITTIGKQLQINLKPHCSYNPQSAGLVERHNGIIKARLSKAMAGTGQNWVSCLPVVQLHICT